MKNKYIFFLFLSFLFIFNSIFATEGVNIYSIKDGKALILLGYENKIGWTDFTGGCEKKKDDPNKQSYVVNKFKTGPKKDKEITSYNMGAAREAHEESMGVFLFPDKDDPEPEKHVEEGRKFFLNKFEENTSFYVEKISIQKQQKGYKHSTWFVKVDYIPEEHLKSVWTELNKRYVANSIAQDYVEKVDWKWFDVNDFIGEKLAKTPKLNPVFVQAMGDKNVQAILINLRSYALTSGLNKLAGDLKNLRTKLSVLAEKLDLLKERLKKNKVGMPVKETGSLGSKKEITMQEAVEVIFQKARDLVQDDQLGGREKNVLRDNPLNYPLKDKTASLSQLTKGLKIEINQCDIKSKIENYINMVEHYDGKTIQNLDKEYLLKVVENAFAKEIQHKQDSYVFYHACNISRVFMYELYRLLFSWGMLQKNQPLALRFLNRSVFQNILEIQEKMQTKSDIDKEMVSQLLSVNLALFAGFDEYSESTFAYFIKNESLEGIETSKIVSEIFDGLGISRFSRGIIELINKYNKMSENLGGILLQIFIKQSVVDEIAYISKAFGRVINKKVLTNFETPKLRESWNKELKCYTKIGPFLEEYINNYENFKNAMREPLEVREFDRNPLEKLQARIWLLSPAFYNPENVQIIVYGAIKDDTIDKKDDTIDKKDDTIDKFVKELKPIFDELIKEFIKKKVNREIDSKNLPMSFQKIDQFIDENIAKMKIKGIAKNEVAWLPVFARAQTA